VQRRRLLGRSDYRHNVKLNFSGIRQEMTKTLLIMRHAKSSWNHSGLADHDRPLNNRGLRDTPRMAEWIAKQGLVPGLVLTSTATRAISTANLLADSCHEFTSAVQADGNLYHASARIYLETAARIDDSISTAMIIGHNPGLEELVEILAGHYERMPTAAIACFEFPVESWTQITPDSAVLKDIWRPKEI
jgi:phosphohistidine phosphatase